MNIGATIKKLRKQKDMTQEQLAEYLNISPQAISRWEINSTLPDITLIPMLANIFDVTTDMLLGVDIDAKEKRIEAIKKEAENCTCKKQYDEAERLLRAALKEYPNSYILMDKLALVLDFSLAAKHAVLYDSMPTVNNNFKEEYTSLLFRGLNFPFNMVHCPFTMTKDLLERSRELDSVLPASELEEIRNILIKTP